MLISELTGLLMRIINTLFLKTEKGGYLTGNTIRQFGTCVIQSENVLHLEQLGIKQCNMACFSKFLC